MQKCRYDLGVPCIINISSERGEITGRAEYLVDEPRYDVRYRSAAGEAKSYWFGESEITPA